MKKLFDGLNRTAEKFIRSITVDFIANIFKTRKP